MAAPCASVLSLFSGYGGFELALKLAGFRHRVVGYVERESYAASVLLARMEDKALDRAPIWCGDIADFPTRPFRGVDLICRGFPCQPWSTAGRRAGIDDDRWLWPQFARIIADVGPRFVFLENVPGLNGKGPGGGGLPHVLQDLADLGFDAEWGLLSAADVGAPHKRQRFWLLADSARDGFDSGDSRLQVDVGRSGSPPIAAHDGPQVADTESARRDEWRRQAVESPEVGRRRIADRCFPPLPDDHDGWERWRAESGPEPSVRRCTDGRPVGLADALHLGGNGLVPLAAAHAFRSLLARFEYD